MQEPVMTPAELSDFLDEVFPQQRGVYAIEDVAPMQVRVRQAINKSHLRPGGTVSGPTLFAIADIAFYAAGLAMVGREAMMVTTSLSMTFLRKPPNANLIAEARILKLGRLLVSGDVIIHSEGVDGPVAQASLTYARPPMRETGR